MECVGNLTLTSSMSIVPVYLDRRYLQFIAGSEQQNTLGSFLFPRGNGTVKFFGLIIILN